MEILIGWEHAVNSMWCLHDNPISVTDIGLSCQVQSLASFQALHPCACSILKMFRTQREVPDFYRLFSKFTIKKDIWFTKFLSNFMSALSASAFCFGR